MIIGPGKISVAPTAHPPPLPKKPNAVSGHVGGPLPIPSKGIRKPPPAVPARYTQAVVVSPITDSSSSTSSSDGTGIVVNPVVTKSKNSVTSRQELGSNLTSKNRVFGTKQLADQEIPPQVPFRSTSYVDRFTAQSTQDERSQSASMDDYSNIIPNRSAAAKLNLIGDEDSSQSKQATVNMFNDFGQNKLETGESAGGYSIQPISQVNESQSSVACKVNSAMIEEALKQISDSSRSTPSSNFGHSRVDSTDSTQNANEKCIKPVTSPWDSIVESWIKESDGVSDDDANTVASALTESFKRSHKNPFLADLNCNKDSNSNQFSSANSTGPRCKNSFSFCVDSLSTSATSNGSTTDSTTDSAVTIVDGEAYQKNRNDVNSLVTGGCHVDTNVFNKAIEEIKNEGNKDMSSYNHSDQKYD